MGALIITLLSGLSFFIGYFITKFISKGKKLVTFAVGFSFSIIIGLILTDILPETLELMTNRYIMILFIVLGIVILKSLDLFIPDHEHNSKKSDHMQHIGLISAIALFLHNIIEGTAIYATSIENMKMGILMAIGVSFHNIPLGIQISSLIDNKNKNILLISILSISTVLGVIILNILGITLNDFSSGILLSITLGMLIYISLFELLCEIKANIKNKQLIYGLIVGICIILFGHIFH